MIFITETGSTYEVDEAQKRVRRLSGNKAPTARQGYDREWRSYEACTPIEVGRCVTFCWDRATTPLLGGSPEGAQPVTMTSAIKEIVR